VGSFSEGIVGEGLLHFDGLAGVDELVYVGRHVNLWELLCP
jgi:hypothetical protein